MILFIDKPSGCTSFDVIRQLRRELGIKKMGHAGTLDPLGSGLLIVATDSDTKKLSSYMGLPKTYEVTMRLGAASDTYDAEGKITAHSSSEAQNGISADSFSRAASSFVGEVFQTPPPFSAKKIGGVRAYKLARAGLPVPLKQAKVSIYSVRVLSFEWPDAALRVECGKGTYIRSLVHDIGEKLGCGAYVTALRRTAIGAYQGHLAQKIVLTKIGEHAIKQAFIT